MKRDLNGEVAFFRLPDALRKAYSNTTVIEKSGWSPVTATRSLRARCRSVGVELLALAQSLPLQVEVPPSGMAGIKLKSNRRPLCP